jgi:uncharacterized protein (TIGR02996 family)
VPLSSDLAAVLPGEADLLAAVVANPADDAVQLVSADWLEERDDLRGTYLRWFVEAMQRDVELPAPAGLSAAWVDVVGTSLHAPLRALDLLRYRDALLPLARPAVAIISVPCPEDQIPVGATKFGGLPTLAKSSEWPRGVRIIHTPADAELARLKRPPDRTYDLGRPRNPCRLALADALDVPRLDPSWTEGYGSALAFALANVQPVLRSHSLLKADHQLFGDTHVTVLVEDPIPGPDWQLLIRFSSDGKLQWGWGDGHYFFWYIRDTDLNAGRFGATFALDG